MMKMRNFFVFILIFGTCACNNSSELRTDKKVNNNTNESIYSDFDFFNFKPIKQKRKSFPFVSVTFNKDKKVSEITFYVSENNFYKNKIYRNTKYVYTTDTLTEESQTDIS